MQRGVRFTMRASVGLHAASKQGMSQGHAHTEAQNAKNMAPRTTPCVSILSTASHAST